ncbi:MAG: DegT/DnrJ/EryC1/StrS aminotransferase family protein [Candidatus Marinimicrobia bacterium]|nr:DegT/DnrJ/EryC1/StrS aminotransferase family protein [Candidatus Neomarinimicrobiota bacterium]
MMYPRKNLDIAINDLAAALLYCIDYRLDRTRLSRHLEQLWSHRDDALVALSVRSAFDALLTILKLPSGAEVIMSGINIPDMTEIVLRHHLKVVPVDLILNTLQVDSDQLIEAISPKTRVVVVAHLFGSLMDMEAIIRIVEAHENILLVEDCAQAFAGCSGYLGADRTDVSMFSFGAIKTATALGGAMLRIRSADLHAAMRKRLASYPQHRRSYFFKRVMKYIALKVLSYPRVYGVAVGLLKMLGIDYGVFIVSLARTFKGRDLLNLIRMQPSAPLLALLLRRLKSYNRSDLDGRLSAGNYVVKGLDDRSAIPGADNLSHTFWLFPLLSSHPGQLIASLRRSGFDATSDSTQLHCVSPDRDRAKSTGTSRKIIDTAVYLPVYGSIPTRDLARMVSIVNASAPAAV